MGPIVAIIAIVMIFSIPLSAIIGGYVIKAKKMTLDAGGGDETIKDLRKQVGNLMSENEEIKERLKNLEYLISDESRRINLEYEKEQILIDKQNKMK